MLLGNHGTILVISRGNPDREETQIGAAESNTRMSSSHNLLGLLTSEETGAMPTNWQRREETTGNDERTKKDQ